MSAEGGGVALKSTSGLYGGNVTSERAAQSLKLNKLCFRRIKLSRYSTSLVGRQMLSKLVQLTFELSFSMRKSPSKAPKTAPGLFNDWASWRGGAGGEGAVGFDDLDWREPSSVPGKVLN